MQSKKTKKNIILGVDPGTQVMGYALLRVDTSTPKLLLMDVIKLTSYEDAYERLHIIYKRVTEIIALYCPDSFAIEAPFFGKNVQSMLKLGRAQGVAIAAAMQSQLNVAEYAPKKIKQSITGNGNASKEQVWKMLKQILNFDEKPSYFDATDALAAALCHYYQGSPLHTATKKSFKGWDGFLKQNEHRIIVKK